LLIEANEKALSGLGLAALAIRQTHPGQRHTGIAYRVDDGGTIFLLHLEWNYRLTSEAFSAPYLWVQTSLPIREQKYVAGLCALIANRQPGIPYGLERTGVSFDTNTGDIVVGEEGKGLTCASFILAVMQSIGLTLLEEDEWPQRNNDAWQSWVVETLRKTKAPQAQIDAVERDVGSRRFTPEEVVASSTDSSWPVGYARARELSGKLLSQLQ
jgi:hypothetical protein